MPTSTFSPSLKQLIALNGHPPILSAAKCFHLKAFLTQLDQTAVSRNLKPSTWMVLTSAALVSLNCPSAFHPFWHSIRSRLSPEAGHSPDDLRAAASLVREASLKTISFIGVAKAINALGEFHKVLSHLDPDILPKLPPARRHPPLPNIVDERGRAIWKSVYRPLDKKLFEKLGTFHPDLPIHILNSHYGALLADPEPGGPIGRIGTSLVAVATLRASGGLEPQLLSHVYGLKKAGEEVRVGDLDGAAEVGEGVGWLTSDEGAKWVLRSVDKLTELVGAGQLDAAGKKDPQLKL
ncbi:hypothetical protein CROQUDRAFT_42502 [Cronartium quercuum f. sp. fusiforme G11]|uniref:Dol-P-Man:Man(5)GlcNAc(2)-PP-Dol alpha-1,3-mannosyltransferase n=1 Tax=Cronartium quercuum f. sp. fusiforme G11 TaxID=708437 RepID=A0A9P6TDC6_9BASI|nr:hypothetical protein CROQUDRAFT_42502 [Cronartium quercuum f. sp. fusiforme G11]